MNLLLDYYQDFRLQSYGYYKGLTSNPKWFLMRRLARFKFARELAVAMNKRSSNYSQITQQRQSMFADLDVDRAVNAIKESGFYLGISLAKETVREIVDFAKNQPCYGNGDSKLGFYYSEKLRIEAKYSEQFTTASYFNTSSLCPTIQKIARDPKLLEIAAKYLEAKPVYLGNRLWWSFTGESTPFERRKAAQMFHYDLDDYRFLKFFFYLTDVNESSGPHVCVRGSHNRKKLSHQLITRRYPDQDMIDAYGVKNIVPICGEAGFGFAEDTLCFHKGTPPKKGDRLMLQIEYAINDYEMQHDRIQPAMLKQLV